MATVTSGSPVRQRIIPELLAIHAEELEFLWARRRSAQISDALTLRDLARINERIEAHTQGLLVAGEALLPFAARQLAAPDRDAVFAAAYPIVRSGHGDALRHLLDTMRTAAEPALAGIRDALCAAPIDPAEAALRAMLDGENATLGASAAYVLASHRRLDPASPSLDALLRVADPACAELAWRVVALLEPSRDAPRRPHEAALSSEDPRVRDAALGAAIWQGEPWVAAAVQRLAEGGAPEAWQWLAATAGPEALPTFAALLDPARRSPEALAVAGRYGNPALIEPMLDALTDPNPLVVHAAGHAITRIVGIPLEGARQSVLPNGALDDFSREFSPEIHVADADAARALWQRNRTAWSVSTRWCRGREILTRLEREARHEIDLQALWDFGARAALMGQRAFGPPR